MSLENSGGFIQASLDLAQGPLARAVLFDPGPGQRARLLLAVHHLAVDVISWRVLLEDLAAALAGKGPLPPSTTPFGEWALRLADFAEGASVARDGEYWLSRRWEAARGIPLMW